MIGVCTKLTRVLACSALAKMNQVEDVATVLVPRCRLEGLARETIKELGYE